MKMKKYLSFKMLFFPIMTVFLQLFVDITIILTYEANRVSELWFQTVSKDGRNLHLREQEVNETAPELSFSH